MKLITKDDDVLDELCHNVYAPIVYSVEAVFEANPGLAAYGPVLPAGITITFPPQVIPKPSPIRLWD